MGTANLYLKLSQELDSIKHYPILIVFLDIIKAYDTVDQGRLLKTLESYSSGPHMRGPLAGFWERQEFVTRKNGYHGHHSKVTRGETQGGLISPTLFNIIKENVVRNWIALMVEDELVSHEGLELAVGQCLGLFYADDGMVG